jgi:alpha-beta hydrolase superfamily lysophospholipase
MTNAMPLAPWTCSDAGFTTQDQTRLFYRAWQPQQPRAQADGGPRALIFLHRGHEHSGRIQALVEQLGYTQDWAFAWDARGHGHSPGERGDAPGFETLVQDFDDFVRHLQARHGIAPGGGQQRGRSDCRHLAARLRTRRAWRGHGGGGV